jgi:hypothetical protein
MLTVVPKNSRQKIQRTRRAGKISVGIMNAEAAFRSAHSLRATASSLVFLFAVPNVSTTPAGMPNLRSISRLRSEDDGIAPMLTARSSGASEIRILSARPLRHNSAASKGRV